MDIGKPQYFLRIESHSEAEERGVKFVKDKTFYRKASTIGRDLAVLSASLLKDELGQLRVLDLMCGSGIRSTRYLRQSKADLVWANDNNSGAHSTIMKNLTGMDDNFPAPERMTASKGGSGLKQWYTGRHGFSESGSEWHVTHEDAFDVLAHFKQAREQFDLIDIDSFGSDSSFIGPSLPVVANGGLLFVTCTDGLASGGHTPYRSLSAYGSYVTPLPFSNEIGLRMLIGGVVREAARQNLSVTPQFSLYSFHGPVFRAMLRVTKSPGQKWESQHYGFIAHCFECGESQTLSWQELGGPMCACQVSKPEEKLVAVVGPLWTGPLHSVSHVEGMMNLAKDVGWIRGGGGSKGPKEARELRELLEAMLDESDPALPPWYFEMDQISKLGKFNTPPRNKVILELRNRGFSASRSHIKANLIKTNCPLSQCVQLARDAAE